MSGQVNETGELVFGDVVGQSDAAESKVKAGAVDGVEAQTGEDGPAALCLVC
ncbi:hypothetical protein [Streptomyces sp. NPDC088910]|uniref:hypothetical protein n=1 Tax=Streptomyces sp. NPDC088910 TaxID=3365911 RepID=UPI00382C5F4E